PLSAWVKNRPVPKNTQILLVSSALTVEPAVIGPTFVVPVHGVGVQGKVASSSVGTWLGPLASPQLLKVWGLFPLVGLVVSRYILPRQAGGLARVVSTGR